MTLSIIILRIMPFNITMPFRVTLCWALLMVSVVIKPTILNVFKLNVVILNVVAPVVGGRIKTCVVSRWLCKNGKIAVHNMPVINLSNIHYYKSML